MANLTKEEEIARLGDLITQKYFDEHAWNCMCGHFESCSNCDGSETKIREKLLASMLDVLRDEVEWVD